MSDNATDDVKAAPLSAPVFMSDALMGSALMAIPTSATFIGPSVQAASGTGGAQLTARAG